MKIHEYPEKIAKKEQYSAGEVAVVFRVSPRTSCQMIDGGSIASHTIPGSKKRRVRHADILKYVEKNPEFAYILEHIEE